MTAPALPWVMAVASADVMPVLVTAVMNSCPTRCAVDIAEIVRSTQLAAVGLLVLGFAEVEAGGAWVVVRDAEGEVAAGELLLGLGGTVPAADEVEDDPVPPLPHAATVTSRPRAPSATAEAAGRRTGRAASIGVGKTFGWRTAEPHTSSIGQIGRSGGNCPIT
jgi:hypothetical protein